MCLLRIVVGQAVAGVLLVDQIPVQVWNTLDVEVSGFKAVLIDGALCIFRGSGINVVCSSVYSLGAAGSSLDLRFQLKYLQGSQRLHDRRDGASLRAAWRRAGS